MQLIRKTFFRETQNVLDEITKQFDFVWPSLAGIAFLQKEVKEFQNINLQATEEDFESHFIEDKSFARISFTNIFPNKSMEEFKSEQAKALLYSLFSIYEGWLLILKNKNLISDSQFTALQFYDNTGTHRVLNRLSRVESDMLKRAFYSHLTNSNKYSSHCFNKQLLCYRLFKEIRNAFIHNAGVCGTQLNNTYQLYTTQITTPSDINASELPRMAPLLVGDNINLDIYDVIGLSDIIIQMIRTIDAELSKAQRSEAYFINELINGDTRCYPINNTIKLFKKMKMTKKFIRSLGFPRLDNWDKIYERITDNKGRFLRQSEIR